MFVVGSGSISQKVKHVIVQTLRPVDWDWNVFKSAIISTCSCILLHRTQPKPESKVDENLLWKHILVTLSRSLVRTFSLWEVPSIPSVSSTSACKEGSKEAHTPEVQLVCWLLVGNTSSPQKKVWLRVCDLPSPVLPRMLTTLVTADESQPSLEQSSEGEGMESCSVWSIRRIDWLSSIPPCKARDCRSVDKTSGKLVLLHCPPTIPVAGWKCSSSLPFTPMCSKLSIMLGPPPSIILATPPPPLWNRDVHQVWSPPGLPLVQSLPTMISWLAQCSPSPRVCKVLEGHFARKNSLKTYSVLP